MADNQAKRILGIDYGTKRVGIAISDPLGIIASPLETVARKRVVDKIKEILQEFPFKKIVVGYPLRTDGKKGQRAEEVEKFANKLEKIFTIKTELWDESYSTVEAERIMRTAGRKPSREKPSVDKIAAAVILQSYLDERKEERQVQN